MVLPAILLTGWIDFVPVIEHFELSNHYLNSFKALQNSLYDKISNPSTLETLAAQFQQCFIESIDRCVVAAQDMPYTNRSNRRSEQQNQQSNRVQSTQSLGLGVSLMPRKQQREVLPRPDRPDSGVVIDDGSDESGSVQGGSLAHKDSAMTVRDSRETIIKARPLWKHDNVSVPPLNTNHPSSGEIFDESLMDQLQALASDVSPVSMDPAVVQAWNNSVYHGPHTGGVESEGQFSEQFLATMAPSNWAEAVYRTDFNVMGESFTGFNGR